MWSVTSAAISWTTTSTPNCGITLTQATRNAVIPDVTIANLMIPDPANDARNTLLQVVTAARSGDMDLASTLTTEYYSTHGDILPLFISAVSLIESIILTVSEAMDIPSGKLFSGICLGLSVKAIEEEQRNQNE
jgi:hypothetical protein